MSETSHKRYVAALHAVQSGVALDHSRGSQDGTPKHLRVGIASNMITEAGLARLLIDKGLITIDEYDQYVADEAEREQARYENRLNVKLG